MSDSVLYKVPACTSETFRAFVMEKYGLRFKKGHYMEELNKAILWYISLEKGSNTHARAHSSIVGRQSEIPKSLLELKDRIIKFLTEVDRIEDPESCRISLKHMRQAIAATKGTDPRTVTKYLKQLAEYQIIKPNDYGGFDFVVEQELLLKPEIAGDLR